MVDTNDPKKPRPPRRRATPKAAGGPGQRKRPVAKVEQAAPAASPTDAPATDAAAGEVAKSGAKPKVPPKPRSTKRTAPRKAPPRKPAIKPAPAPALGKHGLDKVGGKWGVASILGSLAAVAGLTAALLSLKGSTAKRDGDKDHEPN